MKGKDYDKLLTGGIVIAVHMVADMLGRMGPRSFADMFPVTEMDPPLGELNVRGRPAAARLDLTD